MKQLAALLGCFISRNHETIIEDRERAARATGGR